MDEGPKVVTVAPDHGPVLISADVHGNYADFARLREIFLASDERGERPIWISVGDWVHGPTPHDTITDSEGALLYDYPDETPRLLAELFALCDRFPDRVLSICGNHEHAHIGGLRTSKFHKDEAAFLESQLPPEQVIEVHRRFAAWPMIVRVPACAVVVTHGAAAPGTVAEYEQLRYRGNTEPRAMQLMRAAMTRYGFRDGEDQELLACLSEPDQPYQLLVHGHDREETGHAPAGPASLLLCTSFGARQACKTYLWLAPRAYTLGELREDRELIRLWR